MFLIQLHSVSKRYRREWIFRRFTHTFDVGYTAVLGPNGSGKSTLLRILSGHLTPTKGTIRFSAPPKNIGTDTVYQNLSFAAPYIDLIEEMTLREAIDFHQKFKPLQKELSTTALLEKLAFRKAADKQLRYFSSGMKQRLKLVLAICSDTPLLLLDEPTTNLDQQGINWYLQLIRQYTTDRTVIIASNVEADYAFCDTRLNIMDWK